MLFTGGRLGFALGWHFGWNISMGNAGPPEGGGAVAPPRRGGADDRHMVGFPSDGPRGWTRQR